MKVINSVFGCVFFALTDRASTIPSNIRGRQSGTWSAGQENIKGTSIVQSSNESIKTKNKTKQKTKIKEQYTKYMLEKDSSGDIYRRGDLSQISYIYFVYFGYIVRNIWLAANYRWKVISQPLTCFLPGAKEFFF